MSKTALPAGSGGVRCTECGATAAADGKGSPIVLTHLRTCSEYPPCDMCGALADTHLAGCIALWTNLPDGVGYDLSMADMALTVEVLAQMVIDLRRRVTANQFEFEEHKHTFRGTPGYVVIETTSPII